MGHPGTIETPEYVLDSDYFSGEFIIKISDDGKTTLKEEYSDPDKGQQNIVLTYTSPTYLPEFIYVHWKAGITSGIYGPEKCLTRMYSFRIEVK